MRILPVTKPLQGTVQVPGDKSVTHRAIMFASIARGESLIVGGGDGEDNISTIRVMGQLGVPIETSEEGIRVQGVGLHGLRATDEPLDCGNSGTTARMMVGLLAGAGIRATLIGDESLSIRPMARVAAPLEELGYRLDTSGERKTMPMHVVPTDNDERDKKDVRAVLKIASAQVKSCIMLSGLWRSAVTQVVEPSPSRDHTERLLRAMGRRVESTKHYFDPVGTASDEQLPAATLLPGGELRGGRLEIPGDFSSAAFIIAAALVAGEKVTIQNVNTNPTRIGMLNVLKRMGAKISETNRKVLTTGEPVADLVVERSELTGTVVEGAEIPLLIDEIPVLAVVGAMCTGTLEIRNAEELRVKESDRVVTTGNILRGMGVQFEELPDGIRVEGQGRAGWSGFTVDAAHDHRIAMAAAVAALGATSETTVTGASAILISYPSFSATLRTLGAELDDPGAHA